jgi:hypothetical protein
MTKSFNGAPLAGTDGFGSETAGALLVLAGALLVLAGVLLWSLLLLLPQAATISVRTMMPAPRLVLFISGYLHLGCRIFASSRGPTVYAAACQVRVAMREHVNSMSLHAAHDGCPHTGRRWRARRSGSV